jgi:hypothetical protein
VKQSNVEPITLTPPNPVARPIMLQGWYNVAQIHWRYKPSVVQALLPKGFTVDTFDGSAWVGLIPFEMRRIRLPFGPNDGLGVGRLARFLKPMCVPTSEIAEADAVFGFSALISIGSRPPWWHVPVTGCRTALRLCRLTA